MRDLVVDSLATYRLTRLAVEDVITQPVRERIFEKTPPSTDSWSYALTCTWCSSVWIGAAVALLRWKAPRAWEPVARGLAAATVAGVMSERV